MSGFSVSVVIPLHNKAPFIRRTLESVFAQTFAPHEIIIVDDGSTDRGASSIKDLIGGAVRLVVQENAGPGSARNRGIDEANHPWIAFLDGDDVWRPDHLATLEELSRDFTDADVLATGFEVARSDECTFPVRAAGGATRGEAVDYFKEPIDRSVIWTSAVAVRRSVLQAVGGFGSFWPGEDTELWTRLALEHEFAVNRKCTAIYIQQTGGLMESWLSQQTVFALAENFRTIERALNNSRHSDRHADLLRHYRALLKRNVKLSLYRGEGTVARAYIREMEKSGRAELGMLRPLSWLPAPLLRTGMAARSRLRRVFN